MLLVAEGVYVEPVTMVMVGVGKEPVLLNTMDEYIIPVPVPRGLDDVVL